MRRMLDCHWHDYVTHLIISESLYIIYIYPHKKIWWNLDYKMWSYWLNTMIKISAKNMLQWCPLPDWPYLYQYVTLYNHIHIAGKLRCKAFQQCLRHCIWFSIYGDMDQSIHIATSLQHFFCSLYSPYFTYTLLYFTYHMFHTLSGHLPYSYISSYLLYLYSSWIIYCYQC